MITKPTKVYLIVGFLLLMISLSFISVSPNEDSQLDVSSELMEKRPILFGEISEEGARLEWDLSVGEDDLKSFRIYRSLSSSFKSLYQEFEVEDNDYEFLDTDVEEGRTYHYWITARSEEGEESRFSDEVKMRIPGENVPLAPRDLEAFPGDEKVRLTWDKPLDCGLPYDADMGDYILYREKEGEKMSSVYPGNAATGWEDDDLVNDKEYTYYLKAQNRVGKSESTERISFTPTAELADPSRPENLKVFSSENKSELVWDSPEDDDQIFVYRIYRNEEFLKEVSKHTTYFVDNDVNESETYNYYVKSINVDGEESDPSNEVKRRISREKNMERVLDLSLEEIDQGVKLRWGSTTSSEETVGYNIYRGYAEDDMKFIAHVKGTSEFVDEGLENGKVYHYRVRAVDMNNTLVESTETNHAVPMEREEDHISLRTIGAFFVITAIGILIIIAVLKRREPKGPQLRIKKKGSDS